MSEQQNIQQPVLQSAEPQEQEIDLIALVKRLWKKKIFIIYVTAAFMVLGLMVALFSSKEYTASTTFVPQTGKSGVSSSMSSLASLAGINLGQMGGGEALSPTVYPQLLSNVEYIKDLMYTPIKFEEWPEKITLYDYFTNEEYNKPTFFGAIKKYTVGLPGVILGAIRGDGDEDGDSLNTVDDGLNTLTEDEYTCMKILTQQVSININDKDGYVELSARMGEPVAAAELATAAFTLLEKYVTEYKIEKAKSTLDFVNDRLNEAKADFEEKELAYAQFRDANRDISSATAQIAESRLRQQYDLANTIYSQLASQKVQVELQVKEDTPVLSVIKPIVVPVEKSKPKRAVILIAFTFQGGCLGCASVFGLDFLKHQGSSWPRSWKTEEEEDDEKSNLSEEAVA